MALSSPQALLESFEQDEPIIDVGLWEISFARFEETLKNIQSLPSESVFADDQDAWVQALTELRSAWARCGSEQVQLSREGSAAFLAVVERAARIPEEGVLQLAESFHGEPLARFLVKGLPALLSKVGLHSEGFWEQSVWGLRLRAPFIASVQPLEAVRKVRDALRQQLPLEDIRPLAGEGDESTAQAWQHWFHELEQALLLALDEPNDFIVFAPRIAAVFLDDEEDEE